MELIRPAGFNERRCIARDTTGLYGSIVTFATLTYKTPNPTPDLLETSVARAVKSCIDEHPTLSTVVIDAETEHPQLARVPELDLESHIRWESLTPSADGEEASLGNWLERIHNNPWPPSFSSSTGEPTPRPQWRLHLVRGGGDDDDTTLHAAFATSHALSDGRSTTFFLSSFLSSLRSLTSGSSPPSPPLPSLVIQPRPSNPLPQALNTAAKFPLTWRFLLPILAAHFLPAFLVRLFGLEPQTSDIWFGAASRPETSSVAATAATGAGEAELIPTAVHLSFVPRETLASALEICRAEKCRLTALLNFLSAKALGKALADRGMKHERFIVDTAMDLRRCLPESEGGKSRMANWVSAVEETISVREGVDWVAVRRSTETLARKSNSLTDQPVAMLMFLGDDYRGYTLRKLGEKPDSSFSTSNLGVFGDGTDGGDWEVENVVFSQSADGTGSPFNLNFASCRGGALGVVLSWWPGMLGVEDERTFAAEICENIRSLLEDVAKGQ